MLAHFRPIVIGFWHKLNNDWVLNLAALLAYNFLMATFPLLLLLFAIAGFVLGTFNSVTEAQLITNISNTLPSGVHANADLIKAATENLRLNRGWLLIVGMLSALFLGSRLFITIENCFGIIFRLPSRKIIPQNTMAIGLLLVYLVLVPLFSVISAFPSLLFKGLFNGDTASVLVVLTSVIGSLIAGVALFGILYMVVPNRTPTWEHIWPGSVVAAVLLVLYEKLFPLYTTTFLRPQNLGSIAGFALVILIFYYYVAFILLVGAEINSWMSGQRETTGDLQALLHEAQLRHESHVDPATGITPGVSAQSPDPVES